MPNTILFDDTLKDSTRTFGNVSFNGMTYGSYANGLTATASGGQSGALVLKTSINRITTVATAADSVALPVSSPGLMVTIINAGANSAQVFGQSPDTINGVATGTGVALAAGKTGTYFCPVAGIWNLNLSA